MKMPLLVSASFVLAAASVATVSADAWNAVQIKQFLKSEVSLFNDACATPKGEKHKFSSADVASITNAAKDAGGTCVRFELGGVTYFVRPLSVETSDRAQTTTTACSEAVASLPSDQKESVSMGAGNLQAQQNCKNK